MSVKEKTRKITNINIREPKRYQVIMHNDDITTMEFVVEILMGVFHKDPAEAERLMMRVHKRGRAVVGIYPYDLAVSRLRKAMGRAVEEGFPFQMTMEEA